MSTEDGRHGIVNLSDTNGSVGTEEPIRHGAIPEESTCNLNGRVGLTIGDAVRPSTKNRNTLSAYAVKQRAETRDRWRWNHGSSEICIHLQLEQWRCSYQLQDDC